MAQTTRSTALAPGRAVLRGKLSRTRTRIRIDLRSAHLRLPVLQGIWPALAAISIGISLGALILVTTGVSSKWTLVLLMGVAALPVALLVKDVRKLLLVACVVDIPLGLDVALRDQEWHQGGPTGFLVSLMTAVIVVGYALWILERKPRPRFFPTITVPALLYLSMVVVSLFQASNLQLGLFGLFLQVQFFLIFFYLANHVRTWQDVRLIMRTAVLCLLVEAALMVVQYLTGTTVTIGPIASYAYDGTASAGVTGLRVGGTIGGANSAAAFLAPMLLLALVAYLSGGLANTGVILAAGSLGIVALIATASRTAWGSLALSTSLLMTQIVRTPTWKRAMAIVLIGGSVVGFLFGAQIAERMAAIATDTTRPELAYMARNIIQDYPLGVGENNYDQVMSDKYAHPNWIGHNLLPAHNKYLMVWAETGLQGLFAFVLMVLSAVWLAVRPLFKKDLPAPMRILLAGFLCALCGYAFHMITESFSSRANVQILWFLMAMIAALSRLALEPPSVEGRGALGGGHPEA